jgi:hypothetical protein
LALALGLWTFAPRPDLIISADGRLAGLMGPDGRALSHEKGAGFETDTNKISIFDSKGQHQEFSLKQKTEVASDIFKYINDYNQ